MNYDREIQLWITRDTLKNLAAVALDNYVRSIGVINRNEITEIKFGNFGEPDEIPNSDTIPFVIKIKQPDILEKTLKKNGKTGQKL